MGDMLAVAGLMPLHITLKKLFKRSLIRNGTLHPDHPVLLLLDRKHSKGSALHPNSLNQQSATCRKAIRSPLDQVTIHDVHEKFNPLSEHVKLGSRFIDLQPNRVDFSPIPKGSKNVTTHHAEFTTLPQKDDTIHFFFLFFLVNGTVRWIFIV
jgi:hypothetical protein